MIHAVVLSELKHSFCTVTSMETPFSSSPIKTGTLAFAASLVLLNENIRCVIAFLRIILSTSILLFFGSSSKSMLMSMSLAGNCNPVTLDPNAVIS